MIAWDHYAVHLRLLSTYCHALDTADWQLLSSILADDVVFSANQMRDRRRGPDAVRLEGRAAMVGHIEAIWENLSATHHAISNLVVDIAPDENSAQGSCYIRAYHAGAGERAHLYEESLGRFDFATGAEPDGWRIRRWDESIMIMLGTPEVFGHGPDGPEVLRV